MKGAGGLSRRRPKGRKPRVELKITPPRGYTIHVRKTRWAAF